MGEQTTTILTNAACPKCGYDLNGLIREDGTVTCPECNTETTVESATQPLSRWGAIKRNLVLLLAIPLPIDLYSYAVFLNWEYHNDFLFTLGFVPLALSLYYILITAIVVLIIEIRVRLKNKHRHIKPSVLLSMSLIIVSTAISVIACFAVIVPWGDAIASV